MIRAAQADQSEPIKRRTQRPDANAHNMDVPEVFAFGEFTLDVAERRLSKAGQPIALAPKAQDVLIALVRRAGRLVGKRELLDLVWPEAFVEEGILSVHISALRKALGDVNRAPRYIETVARSGYRFIASVTAVDLHPGTIPGRWSIAVLPARPLASSAEADRLLGLALTNVIVDRLNGIEPLLVRPTRAVRRYMDVSAEPADAARALGTDAAVESCFERLPNGLRLSARLVRADDGAQVWAGEFEDTAAAGAALDGIVRALANELGFTLENQPVTPISSSGPRRAEVYEFCGRGHAHLMTASMFEVPNAVAAFEAAIKIDASYAPAHAGLALAYCAQAALRVAPLAEAYRQARSAALRALAMDAASADAQVALGTVLFFGEWDWGGAERAFQRALAARPGHVEGSVIYGRLLESSGRLDEGLAMKWRAFERDPFSPLVHVQIAHSYWNQRMYDEAIQWANKALALDPGHLLAREFLAGAYWMKGDFDRHLAEAVAHARSFGVPPDALEPIKIAYKSGGRRGLIEYALAQAIAQPNAPMEVQCALLSAEKGDLDRAFDYLERAIDKRDPALVDLAVAPQWDRLRADPRFNACLARVRPTSRSGTQPAG